MNRWKAFAGVVAIFLVGVMTGVTGTGMVVRHRVEALHRQGPPPVKRMILHRMVRQLDLTEAQQVAVETILSDFQERLAVLRQSYRPKTRQLFDDCFDRIGRELTPDQKEELARMRQQLPWHFSRHGGPGRHRHKADGPGRLMPPGTGRPGLDEADGTTGQ